MNETVVQIAATNQNSKVDIEWLQLKLDELGIEYMKEAYDIYNTEALLRVWRDQRLPELSMLKRLPLGVAIRRPATEDECLAFGFEGDTQYVAFLDLDGTQLVPPMSQAMGSIFRKSIKEKVTG